MVRGTAVSHSSNDQTATPTKASIMDMPFQNNGKLASKRSSNIDYQDKSAIKDRTLQLNKRNLKTIEKDLIKSKKLQRSQSVDGASPDQNDEEEESQIICTKSRGVKSNKRQKRNQIEKKVLSEISKDDKKELSSVGKIKRQEIEQPQPIDLKIIDEDVAE